MDWTYKRNLATICLTTLLALTGFAWVPKNQPPQDRSAAATGPLPASSSQQNTTDSSADKSGSVMAELPSKAQEYVKDYMQENRHRLERMKGRAVGNFKTIERVFAGYGIPSELKYLAVIESDLNPFAVSSKGAAGPWQIMPETGRSLGLRVDGTRDERVDLVKSTHAAAKYLKSLHRKLGDWLLVIAAYNGGPGRVETAIRQSNSRDFWTLQSRLPAESRNHVKKFIATHYVMEGKGGLTTGAVAVNKVKAEPVDTSGTVVQVISGKFNSSVMAKHLAMDIVRFNSLNPDFDRKIGMGQYRLRLPGDRMELFNSKKLEIVGESVRYILANGSDEMDRNRSQTEVPRTRIP